jgi:Fe-S-cluster containining protein
MPLIHDRMRQEEPATAQIYANLTDGVAAPKMIRFYKRLDDLTRESPNAIACKKDCNYCCHYHIYSTPLEIFTIAEEIAKRPTPERDAIVQSVHVYVDQVKELGRDKHILLNIACSFLVKGNCSIYPIRPLACRRHHSGDVGVCQRTFDDVHSKEESLRDPVRLTVSTAMENLHGLYHIRKGLDSDSYEFHAALLEALTNKASYKRWKSGKSAFPTVSDKVSLMDTIRRAASPA